MFLFYRYEVPVIDDLALPFFWFLGRSESDLQHTCSKYTGSHGLHVLDPSFSILAILVVLHIYPLQNVSHFKNSFAVHVFL